MTKEEKTIEELQATLFDSKLYEYDNESEEMYLINEETGDRTLVDGSDFAGQGLKKDEVIKHV